MTKPDKNGWIRHRGGVPKDVPVGQWVEVRNRDGSTDKFFQSIAYIQSDSLTWKHFGKGHMMGDYDVMAYKLLEAPEQPVGLP